MANFYSLECPARKQWENKTGDDIKQEESVKRELKLAKRKKGAEPSYFRRQSSNAEGGGDTHCLRRERKKGALWSSHKYLDLQREGETEEENSIAD